MLVGTGGLATVTSDKGGQGMVRLVLNESRKRNFKCPRSEYKQNETCPTKMK